MREADKVRETYRDDPTVSNAEYGEMVEQADCADEAREWQQENPERCTCTWGVWVSTAAGTTGWDIVKDDPDCPVHGDNEENEDGSNRDVPPFDNDPRSDDEIKQAVYDRLSDPDYDDDHPNDWEE